MSPDTPGTSGPSERLKLDCVSRPAVKRRQKGRFLLGTHTLFQSDRDPALIPSSGRHAGIAVCRCLCRPGPGPASLARSNRSCWASSRLTSCQAWIWQWNERLARRGLARDLGFNDVELVLACDDYRCGCVSTCRDFRASGCGALRKRNYMGEQSLRRCYDIEKECSSMQNRKKAESKTLTRTPEATASTRFKARVW